MKKIGVLTGGGVAAITAWFLAHLVLAGGDEDLRLGALLGDFVRGGELVRQVAVVRIIVLVTAHRTDDPELFEERVFRSKRQAVVHEVVAPADIRTFIYRVPRVCTRPD